MIETIATSIGFKRGLYPLEYRLRLDAHLSSTGAAPDEEVTSTLFNVDHHPSRATELFAFAERFRNDFMGIARRHELGMGFKLEWDSRSLVDAGDSLLAVIEAFRNSDPAGAYRQILLGSNGNDHDIAAQALRVATDSSAIHALPKRYSTLSFGLAASLFLEQEQGQVKTAFAGGDPANARTITLPDRQRFRVAVRPSIVIRPCSPLSITGRIYWKLPLGHSLGGDRGDDRYDRRVDAEGAITMNVADDRAGKSKAEVTLEARYYRDDAPPRLAQSDLAALEAEGLTPLIRAAPEEHLAVAIKFSINVK